MDFGPKSIFSSKDAVNWRKPIDSFSVGKFSYYMVRSTQLLHYFRPLTFVNFRGSPQVVPRIFTHLEGLNSELFFLYGQIDIKHHPGVMDSQKMRKTAKIHYEEKRESSMYFRSFGSVLRIGCHGLAFVCCAAKLVCEVLRSRTRACCKVARKGAAELVWKCLRRKRCAQ